MAVTSVGITSDPDPTYEPPRWGITVTINADTQADIDAETWRVFRVDVATGNKVVMREADPVVPADLGGGVWEWTGFDYEAPFGQETTYEVQDAAGNVVAQFVFPQPFTYVMNPDPRQVWLIHPAVPTYSVAIDLMLEGEVEQVINRELFWVLGKSRPVPYTGGPRSGDSGTWTVHLNSYDKITKFNNVVYDGYPLLLQIPEMTYEDMHVPSYYEYLSIGAVKRLNRAQSRLIPQYAVAMDYFAVDRPEGKAQSALNWATIIGEFATWQDLINARDSWRQVIDPTVGV